MLGKATAFIRTFGGLVLLIWSVCSLGWGQEQQPQFIESLQKPPKIRFLEDLPADPMHDKAMTACTECHEQRIIVQQRLSKVAWTKEVDKMIKWGALVDAADHDALVDYLSKYFGPEQPPYEAPRSAETKNPRKSAK